MSVIPKREGTDVLWMHIDAVSWNESLTHITGWAQANESRYVCLCNVHSVVTARRSPEFCRILNEADLATPDGMPLAWCLQYSGFPEQPRDHWTGFVLGAVPLLRPAWRPYFFIWGDRS